MPSQPITPITPLTRVMVCQNVPFDSSYTDTITFGSASSQQAYFAGKAKYSWTNFTPVKDVGKIRLPVDADKVYDCNYVCWNNANFGTKWFYGFIIDIQYVNPHMCEITVAIDVLQTWMFDYTVKECFVVREHPNTDELGEHLILEPVELGEYVNELSYRSGHMNNYRAVIMYAPQEGLGAGMVGGLFTGLTYLSTPLSASGSGAMLDLLAQLSQTNRSDNVVATFIMPSDFFTTDDECITYNVFCPKAVTTLGSYTPRNKKLLSYPYNMLAVDNSMGTIKTYRWEYFTNAPSSGAPFVMACPMGVNPEVLLYPRSYNGQEHAIGDAITITGFPQFGYTIDTYRAWLAQSGNTFAVSTLGAAIGGASGITSVLTRAAGGATFGGVTGGTLAAAGSLMGLAGNVASLIDHSNMGNSGVAGQGSSAMVALQRKDFYFMQRHVREDYAAILDDYFDMYGYQTNEVKVPNITGRPSWNYVQTDGAKIVGSIPFDDISQIKSIFDRGITFWHGDYVGNYSRNNQVTT